MWLENQGLPVLSSPEETFLCFFTVRNEVAKVIFSQACVCPQGGLPQCMLRYHSPPADTPRADPPTHPSPQSRHPPPLEQTDTPPPGETATVADGTHPTGINGRIVIFAFAAIQTNSFLLCISDFHGETSHAIHAHIVHPEGNSVSGMWSILRNSSDIYTSPAARVIKSYC